MNIDGIYINHLVWYIDLDFVQMPTYTWRNRIYTLYLYVLIHRHQNLPPYHIQDPSRSSPLHVVPTNRTQYHYCKNSGDQARGDDYRRIMRMSLHLKLWWYSHHRYYIIPHYVYYGVFIPLVATRQAIYY